jgi:hypothetical protein
MPQMYGRNRDVLLPSYARAGKGLSEAIPTDVTGLDRDALHMIHCQVATDCTPTSSRSTAVLQSDS